MSEWKELLRDSQSRWDETAEYWDDYMGEESNQFHRELIRPSTEKLLQVAGNETILDIACGNGNFSRRLAELGAQVVAFDYSPKMIERAKLRSQELVNQIDYKVMDATDYDSLIKLGYAKFDTAVANMAFMDIADVTPLIKAVHELLKPNGAFVFSITHPCFQSPGTRKAHETEDIDGEIIHRNSIQISKYLTPEPYKAVGIKGQPVPHLMFHRPLSYYFHVFFQAGYVLDGMEEPSFNNEKENNTFDWYEIPPVIVLRFRKI